VFLHYVFFSYYVIYSYETELGRDHEQRQCSVWIRAHHLDVYLFEVCQFTVHRNVNIPPIFVHKCNHAEHLM
jgi:hypothetical protein